MAKLPVLPAMFKGDTNDNIYGIVESDLLPIPNLTNAIVRFTCKRSLSDQDGDALIIKDSTRPNDIEIVNHPAVGGAAAYVTIQIHIKPQDTEQIDLFGALTLTTYCDIQVQQYDQSVLTLGLWTMLIKEAVTIRR